MKTTSDNKTTSQSSPILLIYTTALHFTRLYTVAHINPQSAMTIACNLISVPIIVDGIIAITKIAI